MFIKIALMLLFSLLSFVTVAERAEAQTTVTCPVRVEVPSVVRLTGSDNFTTSQSLTIDQSTISFDTNLSATGSASVTWKGNTNSNNGFMITVQRSAITGTGSNNLQADLTLSGQSYPGGDNDVTVLGSFTNGKSLSAISDSAAEAFCSTSAPGTALFKVNLQLNAPSAHGKGSVNTTLTFVAASL